MSNFTNEERTNMPEVELPEEESKKSYYESKLKFLNNVEECFHVFEKAVDSQLADDEDFIFDSVKDAIPEGKKRHKNASDLFYRCEKMQDEKVATQNAFDLSMDKLKKIYMVLLKVGRKFIKDRGLVESLDFDGGRKVDFPGLIFQLKTFAANCLKPQVVKQYESFMISKERLELFQGMIENVEKLNKKKKQARQKAKDYTKLRDDEFIILRKWFNGFLIMLKHAAPTLAEKFEAGEQEQDENPAVKPVLNPVDRNEKKKAG